MRGCIEIRCAGAFANKETKAMEKPPVHFKRQFHFFCGYVIGFLMALITVLCYDGFSLQTYLQQTRNTVTDNWQTAYTMSSLKQLKTGISFSEQLAEEVRILCMVLTISAQHKTRAAHVKATWGKRCTRLIFFSSANDTELGAVSVIDPVSDAYDLLWFKLRQGLRYVYARYYDDYDWFLKADDDTYIIMENLRYSLYAYQPETPLLFGYELRQVNRTYMSGGGGYVLSKEALHRAVNFGFPNSTLCPPANCGLPEDYSISLCLQNVGVLSVDSRFMLPNESKPKIFPLSLSDFMKENETLVNVDWIDKLTPYRLEWDLNCCSNFSISFHYVNAADMYMYEFFIYHLRAAGISQSRKVLPKTVDFAKLSKQFLNNNKTIVPWIPLEWVRV